MNKWDLVTYSMVAILGIGATLIFAFFLRDLKGVLRGQQGPDGDR